MPSCSHKFSNPTLLFKPFASPENAFNRRPKDRVARFLLKRQDSQPMASVTSSSKPASETVGTPPTKKGSSAPDKRFKVLDITMKRNQYRQDALIEILHKAQEAFGYLEEDVLEYIAHHLKLPLSRVYGVATFYHLFSLKPSGAHTCVVCLGTACYVKGGGEVLKALEEKTGVEAGETTPDGQVSLVTVRCIGACGIAPAVIYDGKVSGQQTAEIACQNVAEWQDGEKQ
ncbi:NAD-reducing hydrogenase subunit HoxE [Geitlerinema sp. FC II]|nr:NAD-reducing hydrogenase subunit HoxE [Geitlerinema sp. FC II]